MIARLLTLCFALSSLAAFGQASRVCTNIAHMLSLVPSRAEPWITVRGFTTPGDWGAPKQFMFQEGSTATNLPNWVASNTNSPITGAYVYDGPIDVRVFGSVADDDIDDTSAFQQACWYAAQKEISSKIVLAPIGVHLVRKLLIPEYVILTGVGPDTILRQPPGAVLNDHVVRMNGETNGVWTTLVQNSYIHGTNFVVASTNGISVGATLLVSDSQWRIPPPEPSGANMNLVRVLRVSGNSVVFEPPLPASYLVSSNAIVAVVTNSMNKGLLHLTIDNPVGSAGGGVEIRLAYGAYLEGVRVSGAADDPGICTRRSTYTTIFRCMTSFGQNIQTGGYGYGFASSECTHLLEIYGCTSFRNREDNFSGGSSGVNYHNNLCVGNYWGANTHAAGTCDMQIENNTFIDNVNHGTQIGFGTGADAGDFRVRMRGNRIIRCGQYGILVSGSGPVDVSSPRQIDVSDNYIFSSGRGPTNTESYGILVNNAFGVRLRDNRLDNNETTNTVEIIFINKSHDILVEGNIIDHATNYTAHGIRWSNCTNLTIKGNSIGNTVASPMYGDGTNSQNVLIFDNTTALNSPLAYDDGFQFFNRWGTNSTPRSHALQIGNGATSETIPINVQQTVANLQLIRNRNSSDDPAAYAGVSLISGSANAASGTFFAASGASANGTWRDKLGISADSTAQGIEMSALSAHHKFEVHLGTTTWPTIGSTNGRVQLRDSPYGFAFLDGVMLQMDSTNAMFLPPRMTKAQRDFFTTAIPLGVNQRGGQIWQTDTLNYGPRFWTGTNWITGNQALDP